MRPSISQKAHDFKRSKSAIREIMDYANPEYFKRIGLDPAQVISFAGGWVNHEAPEELRRAYQTVLENKEQFHKSGAYSATMGNLDIREAIVAVESEIFGVKGLSPSQVAIGANSTQLTNILMQTMLDPGDSILLLDPSYCNYTAQILTSIQAKVLRFPVIDQESWTYVAEQKSEEFYHFIKEHKPKVILLVGPDNPSSQVPPQKFVEAAMRAAEEVGSVVVVDFAYKNLMFEDKYPEYFSWAPNDHFMTMHSASKWCRGLGRRLGWIEAPEYVIDAMESFQGISILVPDTLHQMAFALYYKEAVKDGSLKKYIRDTGKLYGDAARVTMAAITKHLEVPALKPTGGLFTCIKVGMNGALFVEKVLKETGVLFVPGWGFGRSLNEAVRVSYGPLVHKHEVIEEGMKKVGNYLRSAKFKEVAPKSTLSQTL